ncbi:MAG: hypothetical protein ACRERC_20375 [Candidatus Binatia bacterium]
MAKKAEKAEKDFAADWFLLQRRLIGRSTQFFHRLSDLASQGSIEPREYIEESFKLWAGTLEEVSEWLDPVAPVTAPPYPLTRVVLEMRSERGDARFAVPKEVFEICGEDAKIELSIDGLISVVADPKNNLRPIATFAPEQNVRIDPTTVTRISRDPELKIYGVSSAVVAGDVYRGVVWGESTNAPGKRFPVAAVEVRIL